MPPEIRWRVQEDDLATFVTESIQDVLGRVELDSPAEKAQSSGLLAVHTIAVCLPSLLMLSLPVPYISR